MHEDDDWEIEADFLDDFIPRDEKIDSNSIEEENPSKRRKLEETSISFSPVENNANPEPENLKEDERNSRLSKILKICNKTSRYSPQKEISKSPESSKSHNSHELNIQDLNQKSPENSRNQAEIPTRETIRENLIKSILNRSSTRIEENEIVENPPKILTRQNFLNSILKRGSKRGNNESLEKREIKDENPVNPLQTSKRNVSFSGEMDEKEKRKQLIFNCLNRKQNQKNDSKTKNDSKNSNFSRSRNDSTKSNESKNNSKTRNDSKSTSGTKHVIVRKFPGPAGLLPDNVDFSNFPMAYLNEFDESENERGIENSRISNFCSQNTKNRFTSGAWQIMIDDLPIDFLQGQEIGTIKRNAKNGLYKTSRTNFMAAMVHHIDSNNIVNLMIILKDSTDEIDASVHGNIFFKFPNTIEVGNVILLKDVAIICSKSYIIALIHPSDIVAIYNEKERLVSTKELEKILKDQEGHFEKSTENLKVDESRNEREGNEDFIEIGEPESTKENQTQILNDEEENAFLSQLNLEEISVSQAPQHIASSTLIGSQISSGMEEMSPEEDKPTRQNSSKLQNRFREFRHREDLTQSEVNIENEEKQQEENPEISNFTDLLDSEDQIDDPVLEKYVEFSNEDKIEKRGEGVSRKTSKLQNRLKQFRHKEDLTQTRDNIENEVKTMEYNCETSNLAHSLESGKEIDEELFHINSDPDNEGGNVNKSINPRGNTEEERNNVKNLLNDQDEILSQINIDDFEINQENI